MEHFGLIHVYCGEGKGKTTAAIGLAVRAAGYGKRVVFVQFLKDGHSGELKSLNRLPEIKCISGQLYSKFSFQMTEEEKSQTKKLHEQHFAKALALIAAGPVDLLVLDEVLGAIETKMFTEKLLIDFLQTKPATLEVVLTGRKPSEPVMVLADYISEIKCLRHPYEQGISARQGIEF